MDEQSQSSLSKHERREQQREQERVGHQRAARRKMMTAWAMALVVVMGGGGALIALLSRSGGGTGGNLTSIFDARKICINERIPLAQHIHPKLRIVIDGKEERIPANVGVVGTCVRPLHTHDGSGEIHVESNVVRDFTLGEFFAVWGKTFSKDQILDAKADDKYRVVMTASGKENSDYERLILRDNDAIEIRYEAKP